MVTWIMQQNLSSEMPKWIAAFEELGTKWEPIDVVPFGDVLPEVVAEGNSVAYGTTSLIRNACKDKTWSSRVFFNPENFRSSLWREKYGSNLFNFDGYVTTLQNLKDNCPDEMFVRPNNDLKDFTGSLVDRAGLIRFYDKVNDKVNYPVSEGGFLFDVNIELFVAPIKHIHKEWRCFVVGGKVVASSQYKFRSMAKFKADIPKEVIDFANEMAKIWGPEKAYVMDICEDMDRQLKVLELNCFNASGLYECDVNSIVQAVEELFE